MEEKGIKVSEIKNFVSLIKAIRSDEVGWFKYQGKTIFMGYHGGKDALGRTRKKRLYQRRRSRGLCVACGKRITRKNPRTGKLYRLCDFHQEKFDRKKQ